MILGHEICGRVEAFASGAPKVDANGDAIEVGSRITWAVTVGCNECLMCQRGLHQKCEHLFKYGHMRVTDEDPLSGGLASHIILRKNTTVFALPEALSDDLATLANCSTATIVAVLKAAGEIQGRSVLVFGGGILGVTACSMAKSQGAVRIDVVEPNPANHTRVLSFGADAIIDPSAISPNYDAVFELSGSQIAASAAVKAPRIGGTVVFAGTVAPVGQIELDPEQIVRRLVTIKGVHNYHPFDLGDAVGFLAGAGQSYPFAELIGPVFALSEVNSAVKAAPDCSGQRILIQP
jgi:putative phosphonate catabolism associated alcohol dehydrogenase